jgi:hypothetical protein
MHDAEHVPLGFQKPPLQTCPRHITQKHRGGVRGTKRHRDRARTLRRLVGGVLLSPLAYQWNELHEFREKLDCGGSSGALASGEVLGESNSSRRIPCSFANQHTSGQRRANRQQRLRFRSHGDLPRLSVTIEYFLPHDRLAVQADGLTSPAETVPRSNPKTGADPFFQRRRQPLRHEVKSPKVRPFWCASFQKFRRRMVTRKRGQLSNTTTCVSEETAAGL